MVNFFACAVLTHVRLCVAGLGYACAVLTHVRLCVAGLVYACAVLIHVCLCVVGLVYACAVLTHVRLCVAGLVYACGPTEYCGALWPNKWTGIFAKASLLGTCAPCLWCHEKQQRSIRFF